MADLQEDLKKAAYEFVVQVHLPRGLASLLPKLRVCPLLPCLRCTSSPPSHLCSAFSPHYRSTWRTAHSTLPVILPMTTICVGRPAEQQSKRWNCQFCHTESNQSGSFFHTIWNRVIQALKPRVKRTVRRTSLLLPRIAWFNPTKLLDQ